MMKKTAVSDGDVGRMTASPFAADAGAAQIANDGDAIRTVGEMTPIILVVEPGACPGFSDDSGNPLLENLICHNRNPFMYGFGKCGHPQTAGKPAVSP